MSELIGSAHSARYSLHRRSAGHVVWVPVQRPERFEPALGNELPLDGLGRVHARDDHRKIVADIESSVIRIESEGAEHNEAVETRPLCNRFAEVDGVAVAEGAVMAKLFGQICN